MALTPITRSGTALQVGGVTKRFSGANMYWVGLNDNNGGSPGTFPTHTQITNAVQGVKNLGGTIARMHTVGISAGTSMSFETAPGTYSNANMDSADWAVYQAGLNGVYIMAPLTDIWNYYHGGMWNFVHWAYQQNPSGLTDVNGSVKGDSNNNQFFGNTTAQLRIRSLFKDYITAWMNHVNPYTGLAYKDDPTIAIIETGNEIYSATAEWTNDIAQYIKSLAPNKLVADGSAAGGLVVSSAPGLNSSYIDILGGHYYAQNGAPNWEPIGFTSEPSRYGSTTSFIDQMSADASAANSAGKAFLVGEFPWTRSDVASYYSAVENNPAIDGDLFWSFIANSDSGTPEIHGGTFGSDDYPVHYPYSGTNEQTYAPALATHMQTVNGNAPAPVATNLIANTAVQHASTVSAFSIGGGTLSLDTTLFQEGGSSLKVTPAANDYPYWYGTTASQWAPVTPGQQYTGVASIRKNTATSTGYHAVLLWANGSGSILSNTAGAYTAGVNGSWVQIFVTGTAPASAAYAVLQLQADTAHATTDTFNVDQYAINQGTNTTWSATDAPVAYTATATFAGGGALTVITTPKRSITVALTGAGSLTMTGVPARTAAIALAGAGALTVTSVITRATAVALSGSGTLSTTAAPTVRATVTLSGVGNLSTITGTAQNANATVTLTGAGALTTSTSRSIQRAVSLTGGGSLSVNVKSAVSRTVALSGSGSLSTTATVGYTQNYSASVVLSGSGTLSQVGSAYIPTFIVIPPTKPVEQTTVNTRNITGYRVQEDATPLDVSSSEGGVGTINFAVPDEGTGIGLFGTEITLVDDTRGITSGQITSISVNNGISTMAADSSLGVLVGDAVAEPKTDTFENIARYYLSLGGVTSSIYFDPSIADLPISARGWQGDAWLNLKQLCMANGVEIALVSNNIMFRPVRSINTNVRRTTDFTETLEKSDIAQAVEIIYYDNFDFTNDVVYPRTTDELSSAQVYQVEAGATLEDDIQLSASVASVLQPICVDDVAQDYDGTLSVYSVRAVDNSVVSAQTWASGGGKIELSINPDTTSLHIKITGSKDQYYGPYRIAGRMKELDNTNTTILPPGSPNPNEASDQAIIDAAQAAKEKAAAEKEAKNQATSVSTTTKTITYPAAVDDYPWKNGTIHTLSPLRYNYRECTDFVAWRINRDAGRTKAPWKYTWANLRKTNGNAIGWKKDWQLAGRRVDIAPVPGCIAWWGSSAGSFGHVAYVQAVSANGDTVTIEEYNWGSNHKYHKRTISANSVNSFLASPAGSTQTVTTSTAKKTAAKTANTATTAKAAATVQEAIDPSQSEVDYNSLRIVGTGTIINKQSLILPTGAAANHTASPLGVTVENPYVSDIDDAYRVGVYVASRYKGESHTISGTLTTINQISGSGNLLYRKIEQFNRDYADQTIAQFNAIWAGKTIADFNAAQKTADDIGTFFDNQVFGNVAGARFKYGNAWWRIDTTTITEATVEFSATRDTMIEDFNFAHAGMTIADFNAAYSGKTMKQFGRMPLLGG